MHLNPWMRNNLGSPAYCFCASLLAGITRYVASMLPKEKGLIPGHKISVRLAVYLVLNRSSALLLPPADHCWQIAKRAVLLLSHRVGASMNKALLLLPSCGARRWPAVSLCPVPDLLIFWQVSSKGSSATRICLF